MERLDSVLYVMVLAVAAILAATLAAAPWVLLAHALGWGGVSLDTGDQVALGAVVVTLSLPLYVALGITLLRRTPPHAR